EELIWPIAVADEGKQSSVWRPRRRERVRMVSGQHPLQSGLRIEHADVPVRAEATFVGDEVTARRPDGPSVVRFSERVQTSPRLADNDAVIVLAELDVGGKGLAVRRPRRPLAMLLQAVPALSRRL